ncbi:hypothetical protein Pint_11691 [Pistacia integerrima]|uniref:Uncharacterized protein n=1 Tax=Pistacia integerrima TaxID=434235 RepID=A0ACC0XGS6_9ROSI|nr:hypothetical protein Pint_11691 [Pistacia integerrima]
MASTKVQRIMTCTFCILFLYFFNFIFRFLQSVRMHNITCIFFTSLIFNDNKFSYEGRYDLLGFDEYMNLVLDDAEEVHIKKKTRKSLGRILLKGDNITNFFFLNCRGK